MEQQDCERAGKGGERAAEFKTVVKERAAVHPETLTQTPSPLRKTHYRPSNFKLLSEHYQRRMLELQRGEQERRVPEVHYTFIVVARIQSIHYQNNRYYLTLTDNTLTPLGKFYYHRPQQSTLSSFVKGRGDCEKLEELQFQSGREGQPYFKVWVRLGERRLEEGEGGWVVEGVERVVDFNSLSYHWVSICADQLRK